MPSAAELRRGAIAFGVFPFAAEFPMTCLGADGTQDQVVNADDFAAGRSPGGYSSVVAKVKLRPMLLLHDGIRGSRDDLLGVRIGSVRAATRKSGSWARVESGDHPFLFRLPVAERYGLPVESLVDLTSVTAVNKCAVWKIVGGLNSAEMRRISDCLARALSLDLGARVRADATELLRRSGLLQS